MVACPGGAVVSAVASAVVTLSIGSRPFVGITLPFMKAYAERIGAAFHVVNQREHEALQTAGTAYSSSTSSAASRFLKLPLLEYFLKRYERILFLDDDILVSANMPDLFAAVPCDAIGATVERHKPVGWHATQWTSACDLYDMNHACEPKRWQIWNSGVMLLSRAVHAPLLAAGWKRDAHRLSCRVLCDQLYLNALFKRAGARVCDLGAAFNFVGSELRRALVVGGGSEAAGVAIGRRRAAVSAACMLHLTRKVPKLYTADWVARRSLSRSADVLQCDANASHARRSTHETGRRRRALLTSLPKPMPAGKYDIGTVLCQGQPSTCRLQPWVAENGKVSPPFDRR